jgi:hypothetical protein
MNAPVESPPRPASTSRVAQRIAVSVILGVLVFFALWLMAVSFVTSVLISSSCCAVIVVASSVSDLVEAVLDAIAAVVFGIPGSHCRGDCRDIQPVRKLDGGAARLHSRTEQDRAI